MTSFPELKINNWLILTALAQKFALPNTLGYSSYLYRGHEDSNWNIESTLQRILKEHINSSTSSPEYLISVEDFLETQFRNIAPQFLHPATLSSIGQSKLYWWPIMRHYGVPTRLIDWTTSLYVATYFAVSKQPDKDAAIYLINSNYLDIVMKKKYQDSWGTWKDEKQYQHPDAPPIINTYNLKKVAMPDRFLTQQANFMICRKIDANIEDVLASGLSEVAEPSKEIFRRIIIPAKCKPDFMRQLRSMNITASTLFPGLDGIGRYLEELIKWDRLPNLSPKSIE
jgi:hypothetical protein